MTVLLVAVLVAAVGWLALPSSVLAQESPAPPRPRRRPPTPWWSGAVVGVAVLVILPTGVGALAAIPAAWMTARLLGRLEPASVRRRREHLQAELPVAVDLVAVALRSGLAPPAALEEVSAALPGVVAEELTAVVLRLELGADPERLWVELSRHPQLGPMGRALHRSARSGSGVAEALERCGDDLRAAARARRLAAARTIEVRASVPLGLCLLPAFVLIGIVPLVAGSWGDTFAGLVP